MKTDIYLNKHILVTGCSSGTGNAVARYLLSRGAFVFLNYRRNLKGAEQILKDHAQARARLVRADVGREEDVAELTKKVRETTPILDGLVNAAGEYLEAGFGETDFQQWQSVINGNLHSVFLMCKSCYPLLKKSTAPRVVNFAYSNADRVTASKAPAYHIAKTGVVSLSKTLAKEWGSEGISVNVVSPGIMFNSVVGADGNPADIIPQGRFGRYEDILAALDFIFHPGSSYITGNNFIVSGGYNL